MHSQLSLWHSPTPPGHHQTLLKVQNAMRSRNVWTSNALHGEARTHNSLGRKQTKSRHASSSTIKLTILGANDYESDRSRKVLIHSHATVLCRISDKLEKMRFDQQERNLRFRTGHFRLAAVALSSVSGPQNPSWLGVDQACKIDAADVKYQNACTDDRTATFISLWQNSYNIRRLFPEAHVACSSI